MKILLPWVDCATDSLIFPLRHRSKTNLPQPPWKLKAKKIHTTYLHCCTSFHYCIARFPSSALHLVAPLPHNHPMSNNNTHIPNKKKQHKSFNAIKHHRISIRWSSLFPLCWEQTLPTANKKDMLPLKTLKPLLFTLITLKFETCYIEISQTIGIHAMLLVSSMMNIGALTWF
jgi:hypothetical protein